MIAFDTDMVGPYGYCADISRSWTCGHVAMTPKQRDLYSHRARADRPQHRTAEAGLDFVEFNERSWRIPEACPVPLTIRAVHGIGMADEWPVADLHPDFDPRPMRLNPVLEENMVVNARKPHRGEGHRGIKLETQVLITANGSAASRRIPLGGLVT